MHHGRILPPPRGRLYFDLYWHLGDPAQTLHVAEGDIRGDGPWRVGDGIVNVLGCQGSDPVLAGAYQQWRHTWNRMVSAPATERGRCPTPRGHGRNRRLRMGGAEYVISPVPVDSPDWPIQRRLSRGRRRRGLPTDVIGTKPTGTDSSPWGCYHGECRGDNPHTRNSTNQPLR